MKLNQIITEFVKAGIIQSRPIQWVGAIPEMTSVVNNAADEGANSMSAAGGVNFQTSSATTATLTALGNLLQQFTAGAATTVTLDAAYNIVNSLPQPAALGQKFTFQIMTTALTTIATPTLLDTAVTLAGTTSMLASALRWYQGQITQLTSSTGSQLTSGTTFTSLAQVGTSNLYTVTLGTNAISPVVGNLIYLGVTAGTLPAGWYPIVKVTSATSFVIAAPIAAAAYTATAATMTQPTVVPVTYSPLVTITGLMTNAANMAV